MIDFGNVENINLIGNRVCDDGHYITKNCNVMTVLILAYAMYKTNVGLEMAHAIFLYVTIRMYIT